MVVFVAPVRFFIAVVIQRFAHFVPGLVESSIYLFAGFCRPGLGFVQSHAGIVFDLFSGLTSLFASPIIFSLSAGAQDKGK
jgi:hypothetical protein